MNCRVQPGAVTVESVHLRRIDDDSLVLLADLREKRCAVGGYEYSGDATTVDVDIPDEQATAQTPDMPTRIRVEHGPGDWEVVAEVTRYTLRVIALRCGDAKGGE